MREAYPTLKADFFVDQSFPTDMHHSLGQTICETEGLSFAETFLRQFLITKGPAAAPLDWRLATVGDWTLTACPTLPITHLYEPDGRACGVILGFAVRAGEGRVPQDMRLPADMDARERWIEGLAGRYLVLLADRLYVDPSNSLTVHYDPMARRIGGCLPLVLDRPVIEHPRQPLSKIRAAEEFYFFGDTADVAIRRMLANHYLDLGTFTEIRHWPRPDTNLSHPDAPDETLEALCQRLEKIMAALVLNWSCLLPVTAGRDSRFLLGCALEVLDELAGIYCFNRNSATGVDIMVAEAICERLGQPVQIVSHSGKPAEDLADATVTRLRRMIELRSSFQYLSDPRSIKVHELAPAGELILRGAMVEMGRSNKWKVGWGAFTPEKGVRAMANPRVLSDDFVQACTPRYAEWYEKLPENARERAVDLAHCELWLPTTQHMISAGYANRTILYPFNDRELLRMIMSVNYRSRRALKPQNYLDQSRLGVLDGIPYKNKALVNAIRQSGVLDLLGRK